MQVQPYLQFDGRCEEAIEFYKSALGAKVEAIMRFKDGPDCMEMPQGTATRSCIPVSASATQRSWRPTATARASRTSRASRSPSRRLTRQRRIACSRLLEPGGQVQMPLAETFFSPRFGMVADRFGVSWMIVTTPDGAKT